MPPAERHRAQLAGPLLLDGAMGTLLIARGLRAGEAPERWNLTHPDRVLAAHRSYADAGAAVLTTNTFGASPRKLRAVGLFDQAAQINRRAVEVAREAAGPDRLVAGDIGPSGETLPPVGAADPQALVDSFAAQAVALAEAGADLLLVETMFDLREALLAVQAALATGLPVAVTLTFESRRRGAFTVMGDALAPSLRALVEAGACAVGFNCSVTPEAMLPMVREAREAVAGAVPIIAQPNAGQPRATADGVVYDTDPETFARGVRALRDAGAGWVGGCCGTDPETIRRVAAALEAGADSASRRGPEAGGGAGSEAEA